MTLLKEVKLVLSVLWHFIFNKTIPLAELVGGVSVQCVQLQHVFVVLMFCSEVG